MIFNNTDDECLAMLRITRAPFFALCNLFRGRGQVLEISGCSVEEQVAMFLHVVGHHQRFRVVHQSFRGPLRQLVESSIKFSMLLVGLGMK